MPELPEVENVVQKIRPVVWGCEIIGLMLQPEASVPLLAEQVAGQKIRHIGRRGKYIIFKLDDGYLISHLRMTGQWFFTSAVAPAPNVDKYFRWGFTIKDLDGDFVGYLWFRDVRKFGTIEWVSSLEESSSLAKLGPDGLTLNDSKSHYHIVSLAEKTKRPIKNFLLDQTVIAGVGNIYASEVLFEAKVSPFTPTRNVPAEKLSEICTKLFDIFNLAISLGGSSISDFEGGEYHNLLYVYARDGEDCYSCGTKIERVKLAGRSTFYCPKCQGVEENELP